AVLPHERHSCAWADLFGNPAFTRCGVPDGIRTRVLALKGPRPGPLDDGDSGWQVRCPCEQPCNCSLACLRGPTDGRAGRPNPNPVLRYACHMDLPRRAFLSVTGLAAFARTLPARPSHARQQGASTMYGLIGKMTAVTGQRDALAAALLEGTGAMPGCLSYVVANDPADPDSLWITEVWDSQASH